jgi:Putative MetA-pathway of phenol degradation
MPSASCRSVTRHSRLNCLRAASQIAGGIVVAARLLAGEEPEATPSPTPAPDKSGYTLFNPTPRNLWRAYNTDRPSKTDSPFTIDAGAFQIETDVVNCTLDRNNPDHLSLKLQTLLVGQTNFKIGLTNWMDIEIFPQGYVEKRLSGAAFGPAKKISGFGDTTVRLKVNFLGNDGGDFALGLVLSLKVPTNTAQLGNKLFDFGIGLPFNYNLPAGFVLFGQTRIDLPKVEGHSGRNIVWSNPIGVSRTIVGKLSGYAEFYSAVNSQRNLPWVGTADVGLIYLVTPNFSVDVNAFFGLTRSADDLTVFTGFGYRF